MNEPRAYECAGEVALGTLGRETEARLGGLAGEWLDVAGGDAGRRIVVRHVQPGGAPAPSAVPAELIAILDALAPAEREAVGGGVLTVRDRTGVLMRLVVERGEIRIQWPREDWEHAVEVPLEAALDAIEAVSAKVTGEVRFEAPTGARAAIVELVESFEGLYPEGNLEVERDGSSVRVRFDGVNVGPAELLSQLASLAVPRETLSGRLEIGSFVPNAVERDVRIRLDGGSARAERPALWREG